MSIISVQKFQFSFVNIVKEDLTPLPRQCTNFVSLPRLGCSHEEYPHEKTTYTRKQTMKTLKISLTTILATMFPRITRPVTIGRYQTP